VADVIDVAKVIEGTALLRDAGADLGHRTATILKTTEGDVQLDFRGINSATSSAACRFFAIIARECGKEAVNRLVFMGAAEWVMNAFEVGHDRVILEHYGRTVA
jgi:hypothetical protein